MKRWLFFLLAISLLGCKNFETKKISSDAIVQEEMQHIDWRHLDSYPSLDICERETDENYKKRCFETEITKHLFLILAQHEVTLKDSVREEVELKIYISNRGIPSLEQMIISDSLKKEIPELEAWLKEGISGLPTIYPGEKRGIPVGSYFKLPLIIQSE